MQLSSLGLAVMTVTILLLNIMKRRERKHQTAELEAWVDHVSATAGIQGGVRVQGEMYLKLRGHRQSPTSSAMWIQRHQDKQGPGSK